jgi:hypothetical protein
MRDAGMRTERIAEIANQPGRELRRGYAKRKARLDKKVQDEKKKPKEEQESPPGKTAARQLRNGMYKSRGNHAETGLSAPFIKRPGGNVTREIPAKSGKLLIHPKHELRAIAP